MILTEEEMRYIEKIAIAKDNYSINQGHKPKYGQTNNRTKKDHIIGCMGEYTVAKYFDLDYKPSLKPDNYDIGKTQIRTTYHKTGRLIAYPSEPRNRIYILVYADQYQKEVELKGWCYGYEIMKRENWGNPFGHGRANCFTLQQHKLKEINQLCCINGIVKEKINQNKLFCE